MNKKPRFTKKEIHNWNNEILSQNKDYIIEEKTITILANSKEIHKVACSPWDIDYLAVGYLFFIGMIDNSNQIKDIIVDEKELTVNIIFETNNKKNNELYNINIDNSNFTIKPSKICELAGKLENISEIFRKTGGVHCAALSDSNDIMFFHEDVGRHNAFDKLLGRCILDNIPTHDKIIVFSGRLPIEIISKAVKLKAPIIISCSAPTNDALSIAENSGLTVVGFARGNKFNVYTHKYRIKN